MGVDVSKLSLEALKAHAYDLHRERAAIDNSLRVLEREISLRESATAAQTPKTEPSDQPCQTLPT